MKIQAAIFRDIIVTIIFFVITLLLTLDAFGGPAKRGFFRNDTSIRLPHATSETFNPVALVMYGFFFPVVVLIVTWFTIDKVHYDHFEKNDTEYCNDTEEIQGIPVLQQPKLATNNADNYPLLGETTYNESRTSPVHFTSTHWSSVVTPTSTPRSRKLRFMLYQFMVFCFIALACVFITNVMKSMTGRLRPDFIDRCQPDFNHPDLVIDESTYIDVKYAFICQGDEKKINDGRKSFPSGHSSSSMTGGLFVAILLIKRCWNRGRRFLGNIFVPMCCVFSISGALIIAVSRSSDNRHHALDISIGVLIGALTALASLYFDMFTPSWEKDGTLNRITLNDMNGSSAEDNSV